MRHLILTSLFVVVLSAPAIAQDKIKADLLRELHEKIETLFEELRIKF